MSQPQKSEKAQKVIELLGKKLNRQIVGSLAACVHCGQCTDSCHYVLANPGDPTFAPAWKADRTRKLFKRHFDWTGRVAPWWVKAGSVETDQELEELKDIVFGKCTNCRRCSLNCPMGVDFATFNRMMRGILVSKDQWEIGNQMGVLKEDYLDTLDWMAEELEEELGKKKEDIIPIDKPDADVVYSINPREVKYDPRSIADAAKIFNVAGENWTMPSEGWDMTNFGLFSGDDALGGAVGRRLYEKVAELNGKTLVISECGHGYRSTRCEAPNWGQHDVPFPMESSVVTMLRYIREGKIKVDKTKNAERVTYHDSCNFARSCGMTEEPRELLDLVCTDFQEMYPNRAENYCCTGGGGAMSMSEYTPNRLKSAQIKADQLKATGAKYVVTSCHNCVDGLTDLIRHYKLDMKVTQLVNLVAEAIVWEKPAEVPVEEPVAAPVEVPVEAPAAALPLAGRTILVADDEPDQVTYMSTVFEDNGATVLSAGTSDEALTLARTHKPDLITLDLHMPGRDVGEVYEALRNDESLGDVKVCIITGRPELRKMIYQRKVKVPDGYLNKPLDPDDLLKGVRRCLEATEEEPEAEPA